MEKKSANTIRWICMRKKLLLLCFIIGNLLYIQTLFAENIYFSARTTFSNSQFWEKNGINTDNDYNGQRADYERKIFSNFFSGSLGLGIEMIIWDNGKKRGSRIFFKSGIDFVFSGIHTVASYDDGVFPVTMKQHDINGGAFYVGTDWDIYLGGTLPKTDFIWGFGCMFTFLFPAYSPHANVLDFFQKYAFYATPSIIFGYDYFIPNTNFKITPQARIGFTCSSVIPYDLLDDVTLGNTQKAYIPAGYTEGEPEMYSGLYIDISVAFSFLSVEWKD